MAEDVKLPLLVQENLGNIDDAVKLACDGGNRAMKTRSGKVVALRSPKPAAGS